MYHLILFLIFCTSAFAMKNVAVFELIMADNAKKDISIEESSHLTDELRSQARAALPKNEYSVYTRDGIIALLPPDEEAATCLAEGCVIEFARAIGAEYACEGTIRKFSNQFSIAINLYETKSGTLISGINHEGEDVSALLNFIREESKPFFGEILAKSPSTPPAAQIQGGISGVQSTTGGWNYNSYSNEVALGYNKEPKKEMPGKIEPQVESVEKKSNTSFWVAFAFDILGAGLFYYGYIKDTDVNNRTNDYRSLSNNTPQVELDIAWKKVDDAKAARNISYIAGSLFLATGIGVHIWF